MPAFLEIRRPDGTELLALESGSRLSIGRADTNDVAIPLDDRASRMHALVECLPAGWSVRDLGSTNGTFVNGERIVGERALRAGDEIRVGETRLLFRAERDVDERRTMGYEKAPELTPREREVADSRTRRLGSQASRGGWPTSRRVGLRIRSAPRSGRACAGSGS